METLTKKSFKVDGRQITYYRPSQARKIPLKSGSNRGFFPSLKPHLKGLILDYESQLERDFFYLLDHDQNCIDLQPQPVKLAYKNKNNREISIFPDCWAIFINRKEFLFEIKSDSQLQKLMEDEDWELRLKAIQEFCKKRNWTYQIMTDKKIQCMRLNNIKDLLMAAKHYAPAKINKNLGIFDSSLNKILKEESKRFEYLIRLLQSFLPLSLEEVISLVKYKIYHQKIYINWDEPLEETLVSLNGKLPCPVYELPEIFPNQVITSSLIITPEDEKTTVISKKDQKTYEERLNLISPIINGFGKEAKKPEILKYCNENKQPFTRIYKWYRIWKKEGNDGLIPKRSKKHSKSHLDPQVEIFLNDAVYEYMSDGKWRPIKPAWGDYCRKCEAQGLTPASYRTFRLRIKSIPASEKRGKYKPKTQEYIKRGLSATYREGRHSGCVIQMDHTLLDIWLIDSFTKQPLGRPWATMGVDVFSRSIWSFFISFNHPSQESVTQAILNGLISKEYLLDWNIYKSQLLKEGKNPDDYFHYCLGGFPTMLQVDNGRDFTANLVKDFCMKNNITLEFRPVKTPEYGGFIESVWDTINDWIRGKKLRGRVYSLPKSREAVKRPKFRKPPDYDAKKDAALTFEDFKELIFTFFVTEFSTFTRARQMHSPSETWRDGLRGDNFQPIGGALKMLTPAEYEKYAFEGIISKSSTLSEKGLRYNNILYSSNWLNKARKNRILIDGKIYEFKISKWDVRTALIKNPKTNEIEVLEAYKFDGDDRITKYILKGQGKELGYKSFVISEKMIRIARSALKKSTVTKEESMKVIEQAVEKAHKIAEENIKERKVIEGLLKTKEGKKKVSAAEVIARMDEKPVPAHKGIEKPIEIFEEEEDDEIEPYPTTWEEAKKGLDFYDVMNREGRKEDDK